MKGHEALKLMAENPGKVFKHDGERWRMVPQDDRAKYGSLLQNDCEIGEFEGSFIYAGDILSDDWVALEAE